MRAYGYDLQGATFGRWLVLRLVSRAPRLWLCRCRCGTVRRIRTSNLMGGHTRSCGCAWVTADIHAKADAKRNEKARRLGLDPQTVRSRIRSGYPKSRWFEPVTKHEAA